MTRGGPHSSLTSGSHPIVRPEPTIMLLADNDSTNRQVVSGGESVARLVAIGGIDHAVLVARDLAAPVPDFNQVLGHASHQATGFAALTLRA